MATAHSEGVTLKLDQWEAQGLINILSRSYHLRSSPTLTEHNVPFTTEEDESASSSIFHALRRSGLAPILK